MPSAGACFLENPAADRTPLPRFRTLAAGVRRVEEMLSNQRCAIILPGRTARRAPRVPSFSAAAEIVQFRPRLSPNPGIEERAQGDALDGIASTAVEHASRLQGLA